MMNGGASPSSLLQQMMGGIPNWCSMNNLKPAPQDISAFSFLSSSSSPSLSSSSSSSNSSSSNSSLLPHHPTKQIPTNLCPMTPWHHDSQEHELPESWSQLLLGEVEEEDASSLAPYPSRKIDNWDDHHQMTYSSSNNYVLDVKQEASGNIGYAYYYGNQQENNSSRSSWSQATAVPASSPRSCITTSYTSNMLDFSNCTTQRKQQHPDHFSECNSSRGEAIKKPKLQASTAKSPLKVRKEKLGDRITALHQLVSPFGKTDTASVLLEAIGYIRFLHSQVEVLSSPYLGSGSRNMRHKGKGEKCSIFPEDPGQLLNENHMKKIGPPDQDAEGEPKDLRSKGLCLVPVSFTMNVGSDNINGADFWAPNFGSGF